MSNNDIDTLRDKFAEIAEKAAAELNVLPLAHVWPQIGRLIIAMNHADPARRGDAVERFLDDIGDFICDTRDRLRPDYGERHPPTRRLRGTSPAEPARIGFNAVLRSESDET